MLREESEAVSEGNGPLYQEEEFGFGQPAPADVYREIKSLSKQQGKTLDNLTRLFEQLATRLEQDARQPRLATKADGPANTKTRERTEGAATVVQAMHGDSFTAQKVQDGPKTSIRFGMEAEPPNLFCRGDVLVEDGAAAPKSCLPSLEMRSPTAAGGLVPTGKTSTATETNFNQPPLRFYSTEETDSDANSKETNLSTSTPYVSYDSSVFQKSNLPLLSQLQSPSGHEEAKNQDTPVQEAPVAGDDSEMSPSNDGGSVAPTEAETEWDQLGGRGQARDFAPIVELSSHTHSSRGVNMKMTPPVLKDRE